MANIIFYVICSGRKNSSISFQLYIPEYNYSYNLLCPMLTPSIVALNHMEDQHAQFKRIFVLLAISHQMILLNSHSSRICSAISVLAPHSSHLLGPYQPLRWRLSHVNSAFFEKNQRKSPTFKGHLVSHMKLAYLDLVPPSLRNLTSISLKTYSSFPISILLGLHCLDGIVVLYVFLYLV